MTWDFERKVTALRLLQKYEWGIRQLVHSLTYTNNQEWSNCLLLYLDES
jgi:hypothetical protein